MTTAVENTEATPPGQALHAGTLDIADRVVAKIARRAAAEVDGVEMSSAGGVRRASGGDSNRVEAHRSHTAVNLSVALAYPLPVYDRAEAVRRQVTARLAELTGLADVEVTVHVARLVVSDVPGPHRRRTAPLPAVNRIVTAGLALAAVAAAAAAVAEITLAGLGRHWWIVPWPTWQRWALRHAWTDPAVRLACAALLAGGVALIVLAAIGRRPVTLAVASDKPENTIGLLRTNVERSIRRAAEVDGVHRATVRITKKGASVKGRTNRREPGDLNVRVSAAAGDRLATLGLAAPPSLRVRVVSKRRR